MDGPFPKRPCFVRTINSSVSPSLLTPFLSGQNAQVSLILRIFPHPCLIFKLLSPLSLPARPISPKGLTSPPLQQTLILSPGHPTLPLPLRLASPAPEFLRVLSQSFFTFWGSCQELYENYKLPVFFFTSFGGEKPKFRSQIIVNPVSILPGYPL